MKKVLFLLLFIFPISLFAQELDVISFNIRYKNPNDGINIWQNRAALVNGLLKFHEPDIFGLQEAVYAQILDIEKEQNGFAWFGVGREDGKKVGEFAPIFFNKAKFTLLDKGHFWLTENDDKPELGWDAACIRIVTWGKFELKENGKKFYFFNTHLDHMGKEARKNSAILIQKKIHKMTRQNNLPVILTGDFNLTPETAPILLLKEFMNDSRDVSLTPPYGPIGTYNNFKIDAELKNRIDYVFVSESIHILKYATLSDNFDKRTPSDHLPVFVRLKL